MGYTLVTLASFAANPGGAVLGMGGQFISDCINDKISPIESYSAAAFGGAVANADIPFSNTIGGAGSSVVHDLLVNSVTDKHVSGGKMLENAGKAGLVGLAFDGAGALLSKIIPGRVTMGKESLTNPLWFLRSYDLRSLESIIDDIGRAAFGVNGGSNIIMNYLDAYFTNKALCDD